MELTVVKITIIKTDAGYEVNCPNQKVEAVLGRKKYIAKFELSICSQCSLSDKCSTIKNKKQRAYYFTKEDFQKNKRINSINRIQKERRKFRNNIEATVSEFKKKFHNGKLKIRGYFRTTLFVFSMAISINFGRIFRFTANI